MRRGKAWLMLDDLTQIFDHEPLSDDQYLAIGRRESDYLYPQWVVDKNDPSVYCYTRIESGDRWCTRLPGHRGKHVSYPAEPWLVWG